MSDAFLPGDVPSVPSKSKTVMSCPGEPGKRKNSGQQVVCEKEKSRVTERREKKKWFSLKPLQVLWG